MDQIFATEGEWTVDGKWVEDDAKGVWTVDRKWLEDVWNGMAFVGASVDAYMRAREALKAAGQMCLFTAMEPLGWR